MPYPITQQMRAERRAKAEARQVEYNKLSLDEKISRQEQFKGKEGTPVTMIHTYPTADAAGIISAAGINAGPTSPDGYDVQGGGAAAGSTVRVMVLGNDPVTCSFTYQAPNAPNQAPVFSILTTTGC